MSRATAKGTQFESEVVAYLVSRFGPGIERRAKHGTKDRGDIAGVFIRCKPCVVEVKNHKEMKLSQWVEEAEIERGNADAEYGVVVHHRPGKGSKSTGESYVTMTLATFCDIIAGERSTDE